MHPFGFNPVESVAAGPSIRCELIVEGTEDGLAAAKARGRVGGRPRVLWQLQLDQAQRMYDEDKLTVDQVAATLEAARSTLYRELGAYKGDCALVVYRNSKAEVDPDTNRRYGEAGQSEAVQLDADRKWWPIASTPRRKLEAIVYVVDGVVARVRGVDPRRAVAHRRSRLRRRPAPAGRALRGDQLRVVQGAQERLGGAEQVGGATHGVGGIVVVELLVRGREFRNRAASIRRSAPAGNASLLLTVLLHLLSVQLHLLPSGRQNLHSCCSLGRACGHTCHGWFRHLPCRLDTSFCSNATEATSHCRECLPLSLQIF